MAVRPPVSTNRGMISETLQAPDEKIIKLAELPSIDGSHWTLCLHPFEYRRSLNPDLRTLITENSTNPFFDTAFLAASRDRITRHQIMQMIVWEQANDAAEPLFSVPLVLMTAGLRVPAHYQTLTHPFAPFGDPLINKARSQEVLTKFSNLLEIAFADNLPPILFGHVTDLSPFMALGEHPDKNGIVTTDLGKRAAIRPNETGERLPFMSSKRRRELNRLMRKLEQEGEVSFEKVREPLDVILRFEEFLLMETQSWKGRRGSSIHVIKKHAAFARQAATDLAAEGLCEIYSMRFNKAPIASTIVFSSGGHYYPWKTTYDQLFSRFSPGSQLMVRLTEDIVSRPDFVAADSLANLGHSWMSNLWPDTIGLHNLILAGDKDTADALACALHRSHRLKRLAKKLLRRD